MEIVLLFACILVAVSLAGDSLLGIVFVFAACQFACSVAWFAATGGLNTRPARRGRIHAVQRPR